MKITVVGNGAFGTAFSIMLARAGHELTLCFPSDLQCDKDLLYNLKNGTQFTNYLYLPGIKFPESVKFTDKYGGVAESDIILLAVPSKYIWNSFSAVYHRMKRNPKSALVLLSKGFDNKTSIPLGLAMNDFLSNFAVISGPTFARELQSPYKAHVASCASYNIGIIKKVKEMLLGSDLRIEGTTDLAGVSWGGCLKNAYAVGYGICDGLGYSETMLDDYIWRAHKELKVFLDFAGAKEKTYWSPAVWGDLRITCKGESRNRAFGKFLAEHRAKKDIDEHLKKYTVEGYEAMIALWRLAHEKGLSAPLLYRIHAISCFGASPNTILSGN